MIAECMLKPKIKKGQGYKKYLLSKLINHMPLCPVEREILNDRHLFYLCAMHNATLQQSIIIMNHKDFTYKQEYELKNNEECFTVNEEATLYNQINLTSHVAKYYKDRYFLFSKYDQGIMLDEESRLIIRLVFSHTRRNCFIYRGDVPGQGSA
jgi:hypothetical protein